MPDSDENYLFDILNQNLCGGFNSYFTKTKS